MKHNITERGDVHILEITGKITIGSGDTELRELIHNVLEKGAKKIILDLHGLKYIDSSGIGELVSCHTTIANKGAMLRLARIHSRIYSLLQLTQLVTVFQIYDSVEDALQSF